MIKNIVFYIGNPDNAGTLKKIGYVLLFIVVVADFLVHRAHAIYIWDKTPGWGAFYGFISCIVIILVSKFLGHQGGIMKNEDYYDD
jgi:hypothetical protein